MKGKERCSQKKVIHRMQIDTAQGGDDEYKKEKEKQRHRSEEADLSRQRAGLQLLRHNDSDGVSRDQIRVVPSEVPAIAEFAFCGGRKSVLWKVDVFEVCANVQREVTNLRDSVSEIVAPGVESLRTIAGVQHDALPCRNSDVSECAVVCVFYGQRLVVDRHQ